MASLGKAYPHNMDTVVCNIVQFIWSVKCITAEDTRLELGMGISV